jgi:Pyruvate/2-oxoacid:ferredoxin oxidoreductase gamma subunit
MVMLGFLSAFLELEPKAWTDIMRRRLPPKFVESSINAFDRGLQEAHSVIEAREIKK